MFGRMVGQWWDNVRGSQRPGSEVGAKGFGNVYLGEVPGGAKKGSAVLA